MLLTIQMVSCDDTYQSSIPDYPVNLELNLTSTYPNFKNSTNEYLLFKTIVGLPVRSEIGFGGIIICTTGFDDYGSSLYFAFDFACPFEVKRDIRVYPDTNSISHVVCEKCGSVFDLSYGNGSPLSGPALDTKQVLKRYRVLKQGDVLYISNR
jgi:nitrite reductase/ring-hydroxylating ferredoxin subunit